MVVSDSGVVGTWMGGLGPVVAFEGIAGTWMLGLGRKGEGVGVLGASSSSSCTSAAVALVAGFFGAGGTGCADFPLLGDLEVFADGAKFSNSFLASSTSMWSFHFSLSFDVDITAPANQMSIIGCQ